MPQFATYANLREIGTEQGAIKAMDSARWARQTRTTDTFLSHSTKDEDLVPGVVNILSNHGASVYIDSEDPELKSGDPQSVARRLRDVIGFTKRFVLFATPKSQDSKWIPWELGLADGKLKDSNVAIFPSAENSWEMEWAEREYLGIYRRIVWGTFSTDAGSEWIVWDFRTNAGTRLREWLRGY